MRDVSGAPLAETGEAAVTLRQDMLVRTLPQFERGADVRTGLVQAFGNPQGRRIVLSLQRVSGLDALLRVEEIPAIPILSDYSGRRRPRHRPEQLIDALPRRDGGRVIGAHDFHRLAAHGRWLERVVRAWQRRRRRPWPGRYAVEEKGDRGVERERQVVKSAAADAVGATLVFLDLLERDAKHRRQLLLAQSQECAAQTQPRPDMRIDGRMFG
jgi:hypothetical protein